MSANQDNNNIDTPEEGVIADNEDTVDDTPDFINPEDVEEVVVDDDVPMEEDDDADDADVDVDAGAEGAEAAMVPDLSRLQIAAHKGPVYAIATHLDPSTQQLSILSGGGDDKSVLHHMPATSATSTTITTIPLEHAHTDSVSCVAFNLAFISDDVTKTPRLAAVGAYDGAIVVYDADTGRKVQQFEGPTDVEWLCFHPKGGTVLLAGSAADGTVWMYHIPLNKCLQVFVGHESAVNDGAFTPDGRWALSCSSDGTLRVWAPKTGLSKHVFRFPTAGGTSASGLTTMAINGGPDGQLVMVGAEDGFAHVCHVGTKKILASLRHYEFPANHVMNNDNDDDDEDDDGEEFPSSVEAVGFASIAVNPNWCATGGADGALKVWDLTTDRGHCRQVCRPTPSSTNWTTEGITRLQWHPHAALIVASYSNGAIRVWDARTGQCVQEWTGGTTDVINDMHIQLVGDLGSSTAVIVTASDDGNVRIFDWNVAGFT